MGHQSYIAWVAISVKMIVTGGMPVALMRYVGELIGRGRPGAARALVGWAFRLELLGAFTGGAVVLAVRTFNGSFANAWTFAAIVCVLTTLHTVPYGVLIGIQRWRQAATIGLTLGAVGTVSTVVVLATGGGLTAMFAVEAVVAALSLTWTSAVARRSFAAIAPASEPDPETRREFNGYAAVASLIVVFEVVVWKRSEFLFLERYGTAAALANYSVAFAMATAIARLPQGMASVLSPAVASMYGAGALDRIRSGMGRAIRLVATVSFPIAAGTLAVGPTLLREIYGNDYAQAGTVLLVLMTSFPFVPLGSLGTSVVHGFGRVRLALAVVAVAAVVDIVTAILVIPAHGAVGAAVANSVAQVVGGTLVLVAANRVAGPFPLAPATLLRAAVASAATGGAAWAVTHVVAGPLGVAAAVLVGLVSFPVLLVAFRGIADDDARWLQDNAGERLGGSVGWLAGRFVVKR
jgi:O-antigen/teichoic acid export membrane protein